MAAAHTEARVLPVGQPVAAQARWFVGRRAELDALRAWLACPNARPLRFLVGAGGIGKTALLRTFFREVRASGRPCLFLDARRVAPNPPAILAAMACAGGPSLAALTRSSEPPLVVIDAFEAWRDLEYWLREHLLPRMPADLRLLMAGRREPAPDWRADPGWQSLLQTTDLHELPATDAREYLLARGVSAGEVELLQDVASGQPLALALEAEVARIGTLPQPGSRSGRPGIKELASAFARTVCDDRERRALDACTLIGEVDRDLFTDILGADATAAYEWLRCLPFVAEGGGGLALHERVREALLATLAGEPERYRTIAGRVVEALLGRIREVGGRDPDAAAYRMDELLYALRAIPSIRRAYEAVNARSLYLDRARDGDLPALVEMVQRREGVEAARWLRFWYARQPRRLRVLRDAHGIARAFFLELDMAALEPRDRDADPLTRELWRFAQTTLGLCPGEALTCVRYWGSWDAAVFGSPETVRIMTALAARSLAGPGTRASAMMAGGGARAAWARILGLERVPGCETRIGEHVWRIHCGDWRRTPPADRYAALARRLLARVGRRAGSDGTSPDAEFENAVARALKHWSEDRKLATGPLAERLRVPAIVGEDDTPAIARRVRALVESAAAALPDARQRRILHRAYFAPAANQRNAAVSLSMGYSTFRRRLAESRRALAVTLRQRAG